MINLDGDGQENGEFFRTEVNTGTTTQAPLPVFKNKQWCHRISPLL